MAEAGKIHGEKLTELFNELITRNTIISMSVVGAAFDRLTCITGMKKDSKGTYLLIDAPDGFAEAAAVKDRWHLRFNLNGPDSLEYIFSTRGGSFYKKELKIPFPEHVERLQRRKDFRVDTLSGTRMQFKLNKIQGTIDIINISASGVYGILSKHNFKFIRGAVLKKDQDLFDFTMVFPGIDDKSGNSVYVKRASVKRIEQHKDSGFYHYAFEFKELEKEEETILIRIIYDLQRLYLRRR